MISFKQHLLEENRPSKDEKLLKLLTDFQRRRVEFFRKQGGDDKADVYVNQINPLEQQKLIKATARVTKVFKVAHKKVSKESKGKGAEKHPGIYFRIMSADFEKAFPGVFSTKQKEKIFGLDLVDKFKTSFDIWEFLATILVKKENK